jgi:hypothetical protein
MDSSPARLAQRLLEVSDLSVETVAQRSGLCTAVNLRKHFTACSAQALWPTDTHFRIGALPSAYRKLMLLDVEVAATPNGTQLWSALRANSHTDAAITRPLVDGYHGSRPNPTPLRLWLAAGTLR